MANEYITDVIDPVALTGYVRQLVDGDLPFSSLFPPIRTDDIEYELTNVDLTAAGEVARYRAWDTPAPIGKRPGFNMIRGELVPIAWGYRLNEKEMKQLNKLRLALGAASDQTVVRTILGDAERAGRAVQNRLTLAHGSLLTTGIVDFADLGSPETGNSLKADFAVPANQLAVTPAGAAWTDHAASVPLTDLKAWEVIYRANNGGRNPDAWGISSEIAADIVQNAQIKSIASGTSGVTPGIVSLATVNQVLTLSGVNAPLLVMFDVERPSLTSGTPSRVVNNRKVIGVRAGMGSTIYTEPPAQDGLVLSGARQMATMEPGIIAYQVGSIDPSWAKTTAEGLAVPVLRNPAALFVATV